MSWAHRPGISVYDEHVWDMVQIPEYTPYLSMQSLDVAHDTGARTQLPVTWSQYSKVEGFPSLHWASLVQHTPESV
jgi:hypothetical protein